MRILLLLMSILLYFSLVDLQIRLHVIFRPRTLRAYIDRRVHRIARMTFALARFYQDLRVLREKVRPNLPEQFLVISNHQSLIDIPVLIWSLPNHSLRFVGKKELFRFIVMVSVMLRVQRHAVIDRHRNFAEAVHALERLGRSAVQWGFCPAVFPEGHRSRTGAVGAFHSGAIRTILRTAGLPVVTVAINGGDKAAKLRQLRASLHHLRYQVRILSVYPPPTTKQEIDDILEKARREISEQVAAWRGEALVVHDER